MRKLHEINIFDELKDRIDISNLSDINVEKIDDGLEIFKKDGQWNIKYSSINLLVRSIGLVVENYDAVDGFSLKETPAFDSLGIMVDCSRNGVISVEAFKRLVRHLSLMGYNTIQLYTEDTFEMEEYPMFGYMRGSYSENELAEMDEYADMFGIELVPCIQTLAHLTFALRWSELRGIVDYDDILLVGEEKTYELIDSMLSTMSKSIKSRNINIGMDEAHMIGLGRYLNKHGYQNRFDIILGHLKKVIELCKKYDYKPMMWSDMFFRLAYKGEYYAFGESIPEEVINKVPKEVSLVYWDYFSDTTKKYDDMLKAHLEFNNKIIFAGGAWKWHGFTPGNHLSFKVGKPASESCKKMGIKDVLITSWGDNGAEGSIFALLPCFSYWAESCYSSKEPEEVLEKRFLTCAGIELDRFLKLDSPSFTSDNPSPGKIGVNPTKYMLYQDLLGGIADKNIEGRGYNKHFAETATELEKARENSGKWEVLFDTQIALCKFLAIKSELGLEIKELYDKKDKEGLLIIAEKTIPKLIPLLEEFQKAYRRQWSKENKSFGLDCFDIRTGGVKERLLVVSDKIKGFVNGEYKVIEELEIEKVYYDNIKGDITNLSMVYWDRLSTFSSITGI